MTRSKEGLTPAWIGATALLVLPLLQAVLPLPAPLLRIAVALGNDGLNQIDYERMEVGYYQKLLDSGRTFAEDAKAEPAIPTFQDSELVQAVDDVREYILRPNISTRFWWKDSVTWSTNADGMRDKHYPRPKPAGTFRVAMIGDSIGAGWGVDDGKDFASLIEEEFDRRSREAGGPKVEILNLSVPGYAPGQRWEHSSRVIWEYEPDLVLYEATPADPGWDERRLRQLLPRGLGWESRVYAPILSDFGIGKTDAAEYYQSALKPWKWELLAGVYRAINADCRDRGVPCVWFLIPRVGKAPSRWDVARLSGLAKSSGFSEAHDLTDAYGEADHSALRISPSDYHPNAEGHEMLAKALVEALSDRLVIPAGGMERTP